MQSPRPAIISGGKQFPSLSHTSRRSLLSFLFSLSPRNCHGLQSRSVPMEALDLVGERKVLFTEVDEYVLTGNANMVSDSLKHS